MLAVARVRSRLRRMEQQPGQPIGTGNCWSPIEPLPHPLSRQPVADQPVPPARVVRSPPPRQLTGHSATTTARQTRNAHTGRVRKEISRGPHEMRSGRAQHSKAPVQ